MKSNKCVHIEDIGEVKVRVSRRAKYVNIKLKPFEGVIVTLPYGVSLSYAQKFIESKREWILSNKARLRKFESSYTIFDEQSDFKTRFHTLRVNRTSKGRVVIKVIDGFIIADIPKTKNIESIEVQTEIRNGINEALRVEAKYFLPRRVNELSKLYGLLYNRLFIKNVKSRWGSCSTKNNINLSLHLMLLPDHLIDYVIAHELAHTKYKNHSKEFWKFLDTIFPNAKTIDKQLNKYKINQY